MAGSRARGAHRGRLGSVPALHRAMIVAVREVSHYDADGRAASGELYYDAMSATVQLGHAHPRPPAPT